MVEPNLAWIVGRYSEKHPDQPGIERGNDPRQAYRQDLKQHADAVHVNLRTMKGSPEMELADL